MPTTLSHESSTHLSARPLPLRLLSRVCLVNQRPLQPYIHIYIYIFFAFIWWVLMNACNVFEAINTIKDVLIDHFIWNLKEALNKWTNDI